MEVVFAVYLVATLVQLIFLLVVFRRAFSSDSGLTSEVASPASPVSVVVCFHNEASRLPRHLPALLDQDYPDFELVAVDDHSTDDSAARVTALARTDRRLRLVRPPQPTRPGKKDALAYGISRARHELILLTDADCSPATRQWITRMTAPLRRDDEIELVLGYSPYRRSEAAVNGFQRFETVYTAQQYLGLAKVGIPYMGVGRNLAYRKRLFRRAGGGATYAHLPGGDDDLLVGHYARPGATATVTHPAAWTHSDPASGWQDYLGRKARHASVGLAYPPLAKLMIGGLALSHVLHCGLGVGLLFSPYVVVVIPVTLLRVLALWYAYGPAPRDQSGWPERLLGYDVGLNAYYGWVGLRLLWPRRQW